MLTTKRGRMLSTVLIGGLGLTHFLPKGISELLEETRASVSPLKLCIRRVFYFLGREELKLELELSREPLTK